MYHLARSIVNNECVSASILLLSKLNPQRSQSGMKEKCVKICCFQYLCQIHSVPGGSEVFMKIKLAKQQIEILVGALCISTATTLDFQFMLISVFFSLSLQSFISHTV